MNEMLLNKMLLHDLYYDVNYGICERVFSYLNPKDLSRTARVCTDWKKNADLKIEKLREMWLNNIIQNKVVAYKRICPREFDSIAKFIDLNPLLAIPKLVDRFISTQAKEEDILKIIHLAKEITIGQFNVALTEKATAPVLLAIMSSLNKEDCLLSILERDNVDALKLILESNDCPFSEEWILNQAMKYPKPSVLAELLKKFPALENRQDYHEWLLKQAIEKGDTEAIDNLLTNHAHLNVSYGEVILQATKFIGPLGLKTQQMLVHHALKKGNKVSLGNLKTLLSTGPWVHNKEQIYGLFADAFILSNDITNIELLYGDFEVEKFVREMNNPLTPLLVSLVKNDDCSLRLKAEREGDVLITCNNGEIVKAHSKILKNYKWFQRQLRFNRKNSKFKNTIDLSDHSKRAIEHLLDFLYTRDFKNITKNVCMDLIRLSNFIMSKKLLETCKGYLKDHSLHNLKDHLGHSLEVNLFLKKFISSEITRRIDNGSLIKLEMTRDVLKSTDAIKEIIDLIQENQIRLKIADCIHLISLATIYKQKALEMTKSIMASQPSDHSQLLPFCLNKEKKFSVYSSLHKDTAKEFIAMELMLTDISQRDAHDLKPVPEIFSEAENRLSYKTLLAAYVGKKDMSLAIPLYQAAADKNYPPAQSQLGYCYLHGLGVEKDEEKARSLFASAGL